MTNKTKDILFILSVFITIATVILIIFSFGFAVGKSYAQPTIQQAELSDLAQANKYYTEQTIINEMNFQKMWEYTENMTEEEYSNTFLGGAKL